MGGWMDDCGWVGGWMIVGGWVDSWMSRDEEEEERGMIHPTHPPMLILLFLLSTYLHLPILVAACMAREVLFPPQLPLWIEGGKWVGGIASNEDALSYSGEFCGWVGE